MKKIIDPDLASLQDIQAEVAAQTGFEIFAHRLDFFGICSDCRNKGQ
jgi:Fur family peroxide stress response transcriptional regulator